MVRLANAVDDPAPAWPSRRLGAHLVALDQGLDDFASKLGVDELALARQVIVSDARAPASRTSSSMRLWARSISLSARCRSA